MLTNADITVYNRKYNPQTRLDEWHPTTIEGVSLYHSSNAEIGKSDMYKSEDYKIRIPADGSCSPKDMIDDTPITDGYVKETLYNGKGWTLQKGDIVVIGKCNSNIEKPSDLKNLEVEYFTIMSYSDNRRGNLPHWRVGGK